MTKQEYQKLVSEFKTLMARGEKDQWKLAQLAYLAIDGMGHKPAEFAADTGHKVDTIRKYRKTHQWRLDHPDDLLVFSDAFVMATASPERAEAIQVLADITDRSVATAARDTENIAKVRDFMNQNQDLMVEAMKDDDTRQKVVTAAFHAASEDIVKEATRATKEAAKEAHKPKPTLTKAALTELLHKTINSGIWGKTNLPMLTDQLDLLAGKIGQLELTAYRENLQPAMDAMADLVTTMDAMQADSDTLAEGRAWQVAHRTHATQ